ncbi:MAG: tetratricopeptide (TPR) repeat protein [Planctomycetota bacterium]|jgi:tetratricopeptide (TPR) repeat protein
MPPRRPLTRSASVVARAISTSLVPLLCLGLLLPLLTSCGDSEAKDLPETARALRDQRLIDAQLAFERGQPGAARALLEQATEVDPVDRAVLEARLALAEGSPVNCLAALEQAKRDWPKDARIYATQSEVFAVMQRLGGAEESMLKGLEMAGEGAELCRARAVIALSVAGGGEIALEFLKRAYELDPNLPYTGQATAQAHLLVGRMMIAGNSPEKALEHAQAAQTWEPLGQDYRDLEAEALAGLLRYDEALAIYAELDLEGYPLGLKRALLNQQAATAALVLSNRDAAVSHYLAARAQGLPDRELGFGVNVLQEESRAATERGIVHYQGTQLNEALIAFERALELDPNNLSARNQLGVVHFRLGDSERAARAWEIVLKDAARQEITLPEPVHLNLARALYLNGDVEAARSACDHYVFDNPEGEWVTDTRMFLVDLETSELRQDQ